MNFQSSKYSAVMMEFVTPPSYGTTRVNVGGIATDSSLLIAGTTNTVEHTEIKGDAEANWPEPSAVSYFWRGTTADGKAVQASIIGSLGPRRDRLDIMAEVPKFVKTIVASAAGTRPYIYQFTPKLKLKVEIDGEESEEVEGAIFTEATFIS